MKCSDLISKLESAKYRE